MANFTVIYDACVLYPAALRDLLMWLAVTDLFKARWTDDIHDEWIKNVLKNPSKTPKEYLATLLKQGLLQTYNELSKYSYKL